LKTILAGYICSTQPSIESVFTTKQQGIFS